MLPNFIVIGAPRCGTTWIDKNLREHPDICMAKTKEVHFFDLHYELGMGYYESFFRHWRGQAAIGEATPGYLHGQYCTNDVPALIRRHLPDVKMIVSLRNPVERLYSEFWNVKSKDPRNLPLSFEEKLEQRPQFIREGFYFEHLQRFLRLFPRENLLVLLYDDLLRDPHAFLRGIYRFVGVDPRFHARAETARVNQARGKKLLARSQTLWLGTRVLSKLKWYRLAQGVQRINSVATPQMSRATRARLIELYRPHNERLARMISRDLSHWDSLPPER